MFTHLRLHTEFSIVDSTNRIEDVVKAAAQDRQAALAITDLSNLFGAVKFYQAARNAGIKPLLGAEINLQDASDTGPGAAPTPAQHQRPIPRVLLLAQNKQGYLNLCELLTRAWTHHGARGNALVHPDWLEELNAGLIMLAGAQAGPVGQALMQADTQRAQDLAQHFAQLFAQRFYLEVQRAGRPDDERHVAATLQLAARLQLPVVATHPIQFTQPQDHESHEARVCIAQGEILSDSKRVRRFTREQYFKTAAQMAALFADIPSALANTLEIATRCNLSLTLGRPQLPDFCTPLVNGEKLSVEDYFRHVSQQGLTERLAQRYPHQGQRQIQRPHYEERLEFELKTILKMGFSGYFLIVSDFIQWAQNNGCPVGPGRGSGAGSLVAYALKITDIDPLQYGLLFERFLNPDRVSMPDFDIDFCQLNRDRVIDYVKEKYGKNAVSQIATFGTMAARAAIRDVGRVLDFPYGFCDGIAKLIPNKPGSSVTLNPRTEAKKENDKTVYALEAEPLLAQRIAQEEDVKTLIELAQKLEGITRNVGMHAGGVLIAPGKLTDFTPLYAQPGSDSAVSQYDKDDVEAVGLVKFDFLGLATLTILEMARGLIRRQHPGQEKFCFEKIPLDDPKVYALFSRGQTEAVFQFESRGMQGLLKDAKPDRLEDIIALNALFRPGPIKVIPTFVARKHGREPIEYLHPLVAEVLKETYGVMIYQEQVMQTAQILAGYSLGQADILRRAMGKKKAEEMAEQRSIFRTGAAKNDISTEKADEIFDLMEKFSEYGFNKSHAAAYSLLAYHTAWLKVHYRAEFFCANMTVEMGDTDKLKVLVQDAQQMGMSFEPPNINTGVYCFEPITDERIRYGLGAIKGTGQLAIEAIVAAREGQGLGPHGKETGPFKSLFDFCRRLDRSRLNKRAAEALIKAGAFDCLHPDRAQTLANLPHAFEFAAVNTANISQGGLFDMLEGQDEQHGSAMQEPAWVSCPPWSTKERLVMEKAAIGLYLSGHLFDDAQQEVRQFARTSLREVQESREPVILAGIVADARIINGKHGRLALFKLDDQTEMLECSADDALVASQRHLLKDDELIIVQAQAQHDRFSSGLRLKIHHIWDLPAARCLFGKYLHVVVGHTMPDVAAIAHEFAPKRELTEQGEIVRGLPVRLTVERAGARCELQLDDRALFFPTDAALARWAAQAHERQVRIVF